jgi:hypothetical protein
MAFVVGLVATLSACNGGNGSRPILDAATETPKAADLSVEGTGTIFNADVGDVSPWPADTGADSANLADTAVQEYDVILAAGDGPQPDHSVVGSGDTREAPHATDAVDDTVIADTPARADTMDSTDGMADLRATALDVAGIADSSDAATSGVDGPRLDACVPRQCGVEIACGVAADGCGHSKTCDPCPDVGRALKLDGARHMVFDQLRGVAYVTMPGSHPTYPNMLLVVRSTATLPEVTAAIPLAAEPNVLALSDDASRLWVGVDGVAGIQEVDLTSGTPVAGHQYKLPPGANYPYDTTAGAIQVLHENASSVIVSLLQSNGDPTGVVVLDKGVPRAKALYVDLTLLVSGPDVDVFGVNGYTTGFDFFVLRTSATGAASTRFPQTLSDFSSRVVFTDNRVYSDSGDVIDVSDPSAPTLVGKMPAWGGVIPLPGTGRALLLRFAPMNEYAPLMLVDTTTFTTVASVRLQGVTEYLFPDLYRIADDEILFLAADDIDKTAVRLIAARTSLLP